MCNEYFFYLLPLAKGKLHGWLQSSYLYYSEQSTQRFDATTIHKAATGGGCVSSCRWSSDSVGNAPRKKEKLGSAALAGDVPPQTVQISVFGTLGRSGVSSVCCRHGLMVYTSSRFINQRLTILVQPLLQIFSSSHPRMFVRQHPPTPITSSRVMQNYHPPRDQPEIGRYTGRLHIHAKGHAAIRQNNNIGSGYLMPVF